jgi:hypothetical protein
MRSVFALCALALGATLSGCGASTETCTTDCPNIAGTYLANATAMSKDKSSCGTLYFGGVSRQVVVTQSGASFTTSDFFGVKGTLLGASVSVSFLPAPVVIGGDAEGSAGTLQVTGTFTGSEGARTLTGTLLVTETSTACRLSGPFTWTQVQ